MKGVLLEPGEVAVSSWVPHAGAVRCAGLTYAGDVVRAEVSTRGLGGWVWTAWAPGRASVHGWDMDESEARAQALRALLDIAGGMGR